jgi:antitoxin component of MazEF toxin-antitoxin module
MSNEVVVQKDKAGRSFFDLPTDAVKHLKLKIGDWVELSIDGKNLYLCKVDMCTLKTSLPPAAVDSIRRFKEEEGYGSEEEAVANVLTCFFSSKNCKSLKIDADIYPRK